MSYEAVLFDMNGVIVDDEPLHFAAFQTVLQDIGGLSSGQYKKYFAGKTDSDGFASYLAAGKDQRPDIVDLMARKAEVYVALAADNLMPYPGAADCIQDLAEKDVPLALVTSSTQREAAAVLASFQLSKYFSVVVTAEDVTKGKPDPEGYQRAAELLGCDPARCLVVEDAPSGLRAAHAAGMCCAVVLNTHSRAELADADCFYSQLSVGCFDGQQ
jgi:HAD superfamily hydrolase (TIGR01509 family)